QHFASVSFCQVFLSRTVFLATRGSPAERRGSVGNRYTYSEETRDEAQMDVSPDRCRGRLGDDPGYGLGFALGRQRRPRGLLQPRTVQPAGDSLPYLLSHSRRGANTRLLSTRLSHGHEGVPLYHLQARL